MSDKRKSAEDVVINAGITSDPDARELTSEDFKRAVSIEQLPTAARKAIVGVRGKQKRATKVATTIRLDSEVVEFYKADGPGWQSRINNDLVRHVHDVGSDSKRSGHFIRRDSKSGTFISDKAKADEKKRA